MQAIFIFPNVTACATEMSPRNLVDLDRWELFLPDFGIGLTDIWFAYGRCPKQPVPGRGRTVSA